MLHALHRGRSFRALTGNQLFVRGLSSTTLRCYTFTKQDWRDVFDGIFDPSLLLEGKFSQPQQAERQNASKGILTENKLQNPEDDDLLQVFRNLLKEVTVDRVLLFCAKLPAHYLQTGIDTLIRVCLEGVHEATYEVQLADQIFNLLQQCKEKGCTPSEVTRNSLIKWLSDNGDAWRTQCFLRLLLNPQHSNVPEGKSMDVVEAHSEDSMKGDSNKESDRISGKSTSAKSGNISAKAPSRFPNQLESSQGTANTQLAPVLQLPGRSVCQENLSDNVELLGLKGVSNLDLSKFYHTLAESSGSPRSIKTKFQDSKKIDNTLNFGTNTSFNRAIAYCASHGEIARCIELIQFMKSTGLQPCAASYEPLIAYFAGSYEISKAEDILRLLRNSGLHATTRAYECLILAYSNSDNLEKAFNLIEEIPFEKLGPDLYNPLICAYGKMGQVSCAISVFRQMKLKNVKPNTRNFATLIRTCGMRKDLKGAEKVFKTFKKQNSAKESEDLILSAMIGVYAACGSDKQIEKVMFLTGAKSLVGPEAKAAMLKGFADGGKVQKAKQIYEQMRNEGMWPDAATFMSFLSSLGKAGELDQLLELFDPFKKSLQKRSRVIQEKLSSLVCCSMVHSLIHHNQLEKALDFLQKIQRDNAGDVETLCLKVFTQDTYKPSFIQHEHMSLKDKLEFLRAMRDRLKVQPTRLAYEFLLETCAREKNFTCADHVLQMMKSDNLVLNIFTYLILLRLVVASENLDVLKSFLPKMRRAVENRGLQDNHVKLMVNHILQGANVNISYLNSILYPLSDIPI